MPPNQLKQNYSCSTEIIQICPLIVYYPKPDDKVDLIFEGTNVTCTDNHLRPVIVKSCMEEYQHMPDLNEPLVYSNVGNKLLKHLLIQVRRHRAHVQYQDVNACIQ